MNASKLNDQILCRARREPFRPRCRFLREIRRCIAVWSTLTHWAWKDGGTQQDAVKLSRSGKWLFLPPHPSTRRWLLFSTAHRHGSATYQVNHAKVEILAPLHRVVVKLSNDQHGVHQEEETRETRDRYGTHLAAYPPRFQIPSPVPCGISSGRSLLPFGGALHVGRRTIPRHCSPAQQRRTMHSRYGGRCRRVLKSVACVGGCRRTSTSDRTRFGPVVASFGVGRLTAILDFTTKEHPTSSVVSASSLLLGCYGREAVSLGLLDEHEAP